MDDAGILPRREMRLLPKTAREQVSTPAGVESGQPVADRAPGLLGDLKLNRPPGLLLDHGRAIANSPAGEYVADEVAAPKLAVDGQIEHRKIALAALQLQANTNCPDVLRLQRALLAGHATLGPRVAVMRGNWLFDDHDRLRRSRPLPPQRRVAVDRPASIFRKGADAPKPVLRSNGERSAELVRQSGKDRSRR
jgi:hypothetical protein